MSDTRTDEPFHIDENPYDEEWWDPALAEAPEGEQSA